METASIVVNAVRQENPVLHRWVVERVTQSSEVWYPVRLFHRHKLSFVLMANNRNYRLHHYCGYVMYTGMPYHPNFSDASHAAGARITYIQPFEDHIVYGYDNDYTFAIQRPEYYDITTQVQYLYDIGRNLYHTYTPDRVRSYLRAPAMDYGIDGHILGPDDYIEGLRP